MGAKMRPCYINILSASSNSNLLTNLVALNKNFMPLDQ